MCMKLLSINNLNTKPPLNTKYPKLATKQFSNEWTKWRDDENREAHAFWTSTLTNVYDAQKVYDYFCFEKGVGKKTYKSLCKKRDGVYIM